jgi:DHA2 family multidrug resistance protein-like MFS transporter
MLTYSMLSGGSMTFIAQHFQLVDHLSPLRAGLALLPGMVAAMVSFQVSPLLGRRIRPVPLFPIGLAITVAGMLILTRSGADSGPAVLVIGFAVSCLGAGPLVSLGTNLIVGSVPPAKAGSAAGIAQTGNEFGYALGIAVLGSIGTAVYRGKMAGHAGAAHDSLAGATETAAHLKHGLAAAVLDTARAAFATELHAIAFISAVALTCVAALITGTLRHLQTVGGGDHEVPATEAREPSLSSYPPPTSTGEIT